MPRSKHTFTSVSSSVFNLAYKARRPYSYSLSFPTITLSPDLSFTPLPLTTPMSRHQSRRFSSSLPHTSHSSRAPRVIHSSPGALIHYYPRFLDLRRQAELLDFLSEGAHALPWTTEVDTHGRQGRETHYVGDEGCIFEYVGLRLHPSPWVPVLEEVRREVDALVIPLLAGKLRVRRGDGSGGPDCDSSATSLAAAGERSWDYASPHECGVTACLANLYRKTDGYIPWHSDEVSAHGRAKVVGSVSLGGPRWLQLKPRGETSMPPPTGSGLPAEAGRPQSEAFAPGSANVRSVLLEPGSLLLMAGDVQDMYLHRIPLLADAEFSGGLETAPRISLTMRSIAPSSTTADLGGSPSSSTHDAM